MSSRTRSSVDAGVDVRPITEDEIPAWVRALSTGFLRNPAVSDEEIADRGSTYDLPRTLAAFDDGRCVATFRSFAQTVTAVGGAEVPADAITNVSVTSTHRRRGILSRMMDADLRAAKERGDVVATLIAAEYRIYGRYGFGPATTMTEWTIDVPRSGLDGRWSGPEDGGRVDLATPEEVRKLGPELHERLRRTLPGAVSRTERWWNLETGALHLGPGAWTEPFFPVYRSASGEVEGLAAYTCDDRWEHKQAQQTATVRWLLATTPAAERALWRHVCSHDWIIRVLSGWRGPDDLLPHHLPDPRAAHITTQADWLWVRVLDVVRALEARTYAGEGELVLEIADGTGLSGGRYLLRAGKDGASCAPTSRQADLSMDIAALGRLWLGDETVRRLAALDLVREERQGAVQKADALLRTPGRPWCPDMF